MGIAAVIIGALALLGYIVSAIPILGIAIDIVNLPLAIIAIILGALGLSMGASHSLALAGLVMGAIAFIGGLARLGGVFGRPAGRPV